MARVRGPYQQSARFQREWMTQYKRGRNPLGNGQSTTQWARLPPDRSERTISSATIKFGIQELQARMG